MIRGVSVSMTNEDDKTRLGDVTVVKLVYFG